MTVWRFTYDPGTGSVNLDFDKEECARLKIVERNAADVQKFKNGLCKVYHAPTSWRSFELSIQNIGSATVTKFNTLKAVVVDLKFYYNYHKATGTYYNVRVVPQTVKVFAGGGISTQDLVLNLIETE